jgi:two-component system phosphate regulon sensor histidine kinase PhoR
VRARIRRDMALLTAASITLVAVALCLIFYRQFAMTLQAEIKARAEMFREMNAAQLMAAWSAQPVFVPNDMRMTLIAPDGTALYDNTVIAKTLDNHADRAEIRRARAVGFGASSRYSDTLRRQTSYFAVRLPDGCILRAAKTSDSIFALFGRALPPVAAVITLLAIIGHIAADRLTSRIVEPLNAMRLDGEIIPPYDELTPLARAITEQRERIAGQLTALAERTATINVIMDNMDEGALLVSRQGTIVAANPSIGTIFALSQPVIGNNILTLLREPHLAELTRRALAGHRHEATLKRQEREYRIYFSPVLGGGAALLFLDTTESGRAERLRREFSANVSHELKTPLTSISGYAEILAEGLARPGDQAKFLAKIKDESARLLALIDDILLLSRLDEDRGGGDFTETDIAAIAAKTAAVLAEKAEAAGVSLRCAGQEPMPIPGKPSLLAELFFNLLENAIKYNRPGGEVEVTFRRDDHDRRVTVVVRDTGIGIPQAAWERVFERFYRVDTSRAKKTGGTGLGLAIAKHIVLIHHGEISLTSRVGEGTSVTLMFPGWTTKLLTPAPVTAPAIGR